MRKTITIPENWGEVKLIDYLEYFKRIKPYLNSEDEDMLNSVAIDAALSQICKVDYETLKSIDASDALKLKVEVAHLLAQSTKVPLVRFFTVNIDGEDVEFGFEPNLDELSYGCYLDLVESSKDVWDNSWMFLATIYRPVTSKAGKRYRIADYEGTDLSVIPYFKNILTADIALGSVFFFMNLQKELLNATLDYTAKQLKKRGVLSFLRGKTSANDMEVLADSSHLLKTISQKLTQSLDSQYIYACLHSSILKNEVK